MSDTTKTETLASSMLAQSSIETVDSAVYDYLDNLNIFCNTNEGRSKIPIIWSSAERSYQIKNNKKLRDKNGSLIPPIVSIERISITKDPNKKGSFQANLSPNNDRYIITKKLKQDKTSDFANADTLKSKGQLNFVTSKKNKKEVIQSTSVPIPIYVTVEYKINIITNYQLQMNEAIQPFMARTAQNYFIIKKDDFKFECFMDPLFNQESISDLGEEERKFKSSITLKVLGQLVGEGLNQEKPQVVLNESPVEIKIPKERIITDTPKKRVRDIGNISGDNAASVKKKKSLDQPPAPNLTSGTEAPKKSDKKKKVNLNPSNIDTIDGAFLDYVEGMNIFCNTNNGWSKVPVIWSSAERAFQIKNNKLLRDQNGSLIAPIISLERGAVTKDPNKKGSFQANVSPSFDRVYVTKVLNQEKTSDFANSDALKTKGQLNFLTSKKNDKLVYQHYALRIPVYLTVEYKINIITNYQLQMNEIVQPFMARTAQSYFTITKDDHVFECFMDPNFSQESIADLNEEERKYKTTITVKTLGYVINEGNNNEDREIEINENQVEIKIPREKILSDGPRKRLKKEVGSGGVTQIPTLSSIGTIKKIFTIGNGSDSIFIINHGFNSRDAFITVREDFDNYNQIIPFIEFLTPNTIRIDMGSIIDPNSYVVTIIA
jgi:hypothetical protein